MIDAIDGEPSDIPQSACTGPVGIKKKEGPRFSSRDLEVKSIDVPTIDRVQTDRQRNVAQAQVGDIGDERRRDLA
jgi:hypothetical protein